ESVDFSQLVVIRRFEFFYRFDNRCAQTIIVYGFGAILIDGHQIGECFLNILRDDTERALSRMLFPLKGSAAQLGKTIERISNRLNVLFQTFVGRAIACVYITTTTNA